MPQFEEAKKQPKIVSPRPGGQVPEWSLWQTRLDQNTKEVQGVKDPYGNYHPLNKGEEFLINKGEAGDYEAIIVSAGGKRILRPFDSAVHEEMKRRNNKRLGELRADLGFESRETRDLDEKIKIAAEYLERMDTFAEGIEIDPQTGLIKFRKLDLGEVKDSRVVEYRNKFALLLERYRGKLATYRQKIAAMPGILDAQVIMGCVVATYDSSRQTPPGFDGLEEKSRGTYRHPDHESLGLITVDLNSEKRKSDNVNPTTSAAHELRHHALAISDYLMVQDNSIGMQSSRHGRGDFLI